MIAALAVELGISPRELTELDGQMLATVADVVRERRDAEQRAARRR